MCMLIIGKYMKKPTCIDVFMLYQEYPNFLHSCPTSRFLSCSLGMLVRDIWMRYLDGYFGGSTEGGGERKVSRGVWSCMI